MDSIDPECTSLKHIYEAAFQKWYTEVYLQHEGFTKIQAQDRVNNLFSTIKGALYLNTPKNESTEIAAPFTKLAESYEEQCGEKFRQYRICLEKVLSVRKIDVMLQEHRDRITSNALLEEQSSEFNNKTIG